MKYRKLGQSDLEVSAICLGSMTWGQQNTERDAHNQLDTAIDHGINFIDTAEMYPIPPMAESQGVTETHIGKWIKSRKIRDKLIVASKVSGRADWMSHIRGGEICLDRENIEAAVDASLQRLQTDYIDLYQIHWPDRDTNFFGRLGYYHSDNKKSVPIEETLFVLDGLVKAGKIREIGISNETPWGLSKFLAASQQRNYKRIISIQNPYSLLNRTFEIGHAEFCHRENIALLAYSPLGFGVLTGKYLNDQWPQGSRLKLFKHYRRYCKPNAIEATQLYVKLASDLNLDPAQMALAYVHSRSFIGSTIIGATTPSQLLTNIASIDIELDREVVMEIEKIHEKFPNPSP